MFSGFDLHLKENTATFLACEGTGKEHLQKSKLPIQQALEEFVIKGTNVPDGTAIQTHWFPQVNADIFISHAHADERLANGLAGWLCSNFGLSCFIDSNVWGYADNLLELINEKYSNKRSDGKGGYLYDHQSCIAASKHVDTMLTMALHQMIDRCECIMFLNTDRSIQHYNNLPHDTTYSPWIYSELTCSALIRHRKLSEYRSAQLPHVRHSEFSAVQESFSPAYEVSTNHLYSLTNSDLSLWKSKSVIRTANQHPLDLLYQIKGLLKGGET